nr:MAG TPA: GTP cyclohydrolase II [Caudoviricetes sp.]
MTLTLGNDEFNTLAEIIAKKVAESIKGCVPEKTSEAVKKANEEVVKEEPKKEVKEEVVEAKKEESGLSLEQVIKAVKDYTLKDKDGAKKLKPILQSLGVERLSLLPNDKLPEFVEGIRKVGVEI